MNSLRLGRHLVLLAGLSGIGCGSSYETHVEGSGTREVPAAEPMVVECQRCTEKSRLAAEACGTASDAADLQAAAVIAASLERSVHELIACGGLTREIPIALLETTVSMIANLGGASLPAGFTFVEGGAYHTEGNGASMDIRLFFDEGAGYEVVRENLFELDSYLVNPSLVADASVDFDWSDPFATSVHVSEPGIAYEKAGPWAILLGFDPAPPNPITVTDLDDISLRFDELKAQVSIHYEDEREGVRITYDVESPLVGLGELVGGGRLAFRVRSIEGGAVDGSLVLEVDASDWSIEFMESNLLDGNVAFAISGGARQFQGNIAYDESAYGDVGVRCVVPSN